MDSSRIASSVGWAELVKPNISSLAMSTDRASIAVGLHEKRSAQPTKLCTSKEKYPARDAHGCASAAERMDARERPGRDPQ